MQDIFARTSCPRRRREKLCSDKSITKSGRHDTGFALANKEGRLKTTRNFVIPALPKLPSKFYRNGRLCKPAAYKKVGGARHRVRSLRPERSPGKNSPQIGHQFRRRCLVNPSLARSLACATNNNPYTGNDCIMHTPHER